MTELATNKHKHYSVIASFQGIVMNPIFIALNLSVFILFIILAASYLSSFVLGASMLGLFALLNSIKAHVAANNKRKVAKIERMEQDYILKEVLFKTEQCTIDTSLINQALVIKNNDADAAFKLLSERLHSSQSVKSSLLRQPQTNPFLKPNPLAMELNKLLITYPKIPTQSDRSTLSLHLHNLEAHHTKVLLCFHAFMDEFCAKINQINDIALSPR